MNFPSLIEHARIFKQMLDLNMECSLFVSNLSTYVYVEESPRLPFGLHVGDPVREGSVLKEVLTSQMPVKKRMNQSIFGIPYIAMAVPVFDEDQQICGGVICCISTEQQEKLSSSAHELSSMMEEISATADSFAKNADALANATMGIVDLTKMLDTQMREIEKVNQVIGQIARKTNLLGLNASIEAAHAGQYGRSFAIVAGEVRRLAQESQVSAHGVNENVEKVKASVKEILTQAESIAATGQEQAASAQELAAIIQQINRLATLLDEMAK
jgi:hypothetical protein